MALSIWKSEEPDGPGNPARVSVILKSYPFFITFARTDISIYFYSFYLPSSMKLRHGLPPDYKNFYSLPLGCAV